MDISLGSAVENSQEKEAIAIRFERQSRLENPWLAHGPNGLYISHEFH